MRSWVRIGCLLPLLLACSEPKGVDAEKAPDSSASPPTNRIEIPITVRNNLGIDFAPVEVRQVARTRRIPGDFELEPRARRQYRLTLRGQVELQVDQYERVEAGQVLFRFRSPAWPELAHEIVVGEQEMESAAAQIEVAETKIEEARRKLTLIQERIAALARADFKRADLEVTAAEIEASLPRLVAEKELAEARARNAERSREHGLHLAAMATGLTEAELEAPVASGGTEVPAYRALDWIEVRASEPGVVEELAVTDGSFEEASSLVLSTVQPERLRFRAIALQADLPQLLSATRARIVPPRSEGLTLEEGIPAEVRLGLEAHPRERTVTLLASPSELSPWARPGVSAFLEVVLEESETPQLAIPTSAIVQDGLQHVFFRRDPKNPDQVMRLEADLGISDGRWTVLNSGVQRGDEVVLHGAYELKLASQQQGTGGSKSGHIHADGSFHDE